VSKRLLALRGDAALVARVRAGDVAAFEVLYERHLPAILSFCRHMLGSPDEGEDAVQNVFVSAHRHLLADAREINLKPWLYAIARNRCLSMLRARREDVVEDVEVSTKGLDEVVQQRADLRSLLADLRDLPEDQRAALMLTELGDLSHAEVAEVLECEPVQVKGFVFRARSGLAERREAREASCEDIRIELADARGGGVRRGRLKHHLKACPPCAAFMGDLRRQRKMMGLILPVAPTIGLKDSVLGALTAGGGGAAGGAAVAGGAAATAAGLGPAGGAVSLVTASVAKIAAVGVLAGGAGVAVVAGDVDRSPSPPAQRAEPAPAPSPGGVSPLVPDGGRELSRQAVEAGRARGTGDPAQGRTQRRGSDLPEKANGRARKIAEGTRRGNGRGATQKPSVPLRRAKVSPPSKAAPPRANSEVPSTPRGSGDTSAPPATSQRPAAPAKPVAKDRPAPLVQVPRVGQPRE
jgi:RNA polymerase sigma factor (sigma-70 family)